MNAIKTDMSEEDEEEEEEEEGCGFERGGVNRVNNRIWALPRGR